MLQGVNASKGITTATSGDVQVVKAFFPAGFSATTKRIMLGNVPVALYVNASGKYAIGTLVEAGTKSGNTMYGTTRIATSSTGGLSVSEDLDTVIVSTNMWHGIHIATNAAGAIAMVNSGVAATTTTVSSIGSKRLRIIKNSGKFYLSVSKI